ncbi:rCG38934, partial [Rattus norvegicus]
MGSSGVHSVVPCETSLMQGSGGGVTAWDRWTAPSKGLLLAVHALTRGCHLRPHPRRQRSTRARGQSPTPHLSWAPYLEAREAKGPSRCHHRQQARPLPRLHLLPPPTTTITTTTMVTAMVAWG